mmetsp:Transcript_9744/g.21734  ORF Transcript_9744/g.21734 Transcript_9744/m.21734 type:complete len:81 (+) Transcript_9744:23-265(+)
MALPEEIHIYHSDSSDVQQANTPVSALSDVHQGGLRAVSLYKVLSRGGVGRSQASRGGSLLFPGVGFPDIRVFHQSQLAS